MKRSTAFFLGLSLATMLGAGIARAADELFDFEMLRHRAKLLAASPYTPPPLVPEWLRRLSYDDHRQIQFDASRSLWRRESLPFQAQFFHPGNLFDKVVHVAEVQGRRAQPIAFNRQYFSYDRLKLGPMPEEMGFAGFRLIFPLNHADDELGAFLGASYFRFLCERALSTVSPRAGSRSTRPSTGRRSFRCSPISGSSGPRQTRNT